MKNTLSEYIKKGHYDFQDKSVLIIGSGPIVFEHVKALLRLKIKDITILGNSKEGLKKFKRFSNIKLIHGGYEKKISEIESKDLTIVATPISLLLNAAQFAINNKQSRILIEKPGSVYKNELTKFKKIVSNQKIRIGYNRLMYPSFSKLKELTEKDGGITSCKFDFTEWTHTIPFGKYNKETYERWGISNSLHVISMAFRLIGMPKTMISLQSGNLKWHAAGKIFVGCGISENDIPFSYHSNWDGAGRWGIEVITKKNCYQLIPLEKLYVQRRGSIKWNEINIDTPFHDIKMGFTEQIIVMLNDQLEEKNKMITIADAYKLNKITEKIFGYS